MDKVFSDDAVTFVSKKVCVFSSDIRRTLNVCRKAVEICQENGKKDDYTSFRPIEVSEIREAYDSLYKSVYIECLKQFNDLQKILLIALALENKHQEIGRVSFYKVNALIFNFFYIF